ncbi:hypothetical protein COLU111180_00790 [Cohnella lubricantis]|uniref:Uncharacterized protein n=1 Tax=Cohnella lubricantis TaxID=2163172 RepID=A0A841TD16_9BACL|nr:hypothetical protein [Cohnella lubricantis]MBB6676867.1 hypothetical protein [Cohnella lubricantis]MBP2119447.1 hypothetical protein [Cohnella lubricantis]
MEWPSAWSSLVSLFLVFWIGSAWFAAMHPRVFRRCLRAFGLADRSGEAELPPALVRWIALAYAAAGVLMLRLPGLW